MDIFNLDKLSLFIIFFVPGFVSSKMWDLVVPSQSKKASDYILETISYSCINFASLFWLIKYMNSTEFQRNCTIWYYILTLFVLLIMPIIWPLLISKLLRCKLLRGYIIHPIPRSWDYFFGKGEACYALIHLKNSKLIGGLYGENSFTSSYPNNEDIYIEEVWKVNEAGEFISKIEESKGVWISKDYFDYIEFFNVDYEEESHNGRSEKINQGRVSANNKGI